MPQAIGAVLTAVKGFFASTAFSIGKFAITWGNVASGALLASTVAYSSYQQRKALRAAAAALNQGRTIMVREPAYPRQLIYGEVRSSGPLVFVDVTGTDNEYLHMIIALAGHEVQEIGNVYFDDTVVSLDGSGNVTTSPWNGFARVKKHLGTSSQTADSDLVSESSNWTTNHRLRGIAYLYVRLKYDVEVFPGGWPNISAMVKGKKVYDPRTSTTAYSANWALCLGDYLTDSTLGLGHAVADIDDTAWQAAANVADENVTLTDLTTEKRYAVGGVILSDSQPGDVIDQLTRAGAGFCGYIGGKWVIHAGAYRTPTITFSEDDLIAPISAQTKVSRREIFNGGKGVFISPDNNWQAADYPPITNSTYTTEDGGTRIWQDFEWPFTTSNATAQRLTKIALERTRQQIQFWAEMKLTALQCQAGDVVQWDNTRMGWSGKDFEVVEWRFAPEQQGDGIGLKVRCLFRETASGVWDWNNGEETDIDLAPDTNLPDPRTVAAPTSLLLESGSTEIYQQADGTVIPRIKASWTTPADQFVKAGGYIRIEFKKSADSTWLPWTLVRGDVTEDYLTDVEDGVAYDVRIRAENNLGATSSWVSDSITTGQKTSAPNAPSAVGFDKSGVAAKLITASELVPFGTRISWTAPSDNDIDYYEVKVTTTNSDGAVDYSWTQADGSSGLMQTKELFVDVYRLTLGAGYCRVRSVDKSGNSSSWATGPANINNATYVRYVIGNLSEQSADAVSVTGITTGNGSSTPKILTRAAVNHSGTLTGGSSSENVDISLTDLGFSTKPDGPSGGGIVNSNNLLWRYDWDSASSTSTNARVVVFTRDGTNIVASSAYRIQTEFYEI